MGSHCTKKEDPKVPAPTEIDSSREEEPDFNGFKIRVLDETPLSDEGELNRVFMFYEGMVLREPENPDWLVKMGYCLYAKGRISEAEMNFRRAVTKGTDVDGKTYYTLGVICQKSGKFGEAKDFYSKSLEKDPSYPKAHNKLGEVFIALKDNDGALSHLQAACEQDSSDADIRNNLGQCLLNLERIREATGHLQAAVALNPGLARAHNNLANAYRKQGKLNDSIKHYLLAIDKTPRRNFAAAHLNLAAAYFDSGDTASALRHFEEAMHIGTHIHKIMVAKGYHLLFKHPRIREGIESYLSQKYEAAKETLGEVRNTDKKNLIVAYYLASAYLKLGEEDKAKALFMQVIKLGKSRGNSEKHFVRQFVHRAEKMLAMIEGDFDEEDSEQPSILERSELLNESIYIQQPVPGSSHSSNKPSVALPETNEDVLHDLHDSP